MSDSHRKVVKSFPSLPFEDEDGLSTFDLNLINYKRKRYMPAFKRRKQERIKREDYDQLIAA